MDLGEKIAKLRKDSGYTRNEFAARLKMSPNTLRNYELGIHEPGHDFIMTIAKEFEVSTDYLFGLTDSVVSNTKKSPIPAEAETEDIYSEDDQKGINALYELLVSLGYIRKGNDLTDTQTRVLIGMLQIVDAVFGQGDNGAPKAG